MFLFELDLQRFADGGAGGDGGAMSAANTTTGVSAPDAGVQNELQQPRTSRQRERAMRRQKRESQQIGTVANVPDAGSAATGANEPGLDTKEPQVMEQPTQAASAPQEKEPPASFDDILKDPAHKKAFDQKVNEMFRQRFGEDRQRQARDENVNKLLITLSQMMGQTVEDPAQLDPAALHTALMENQSLIEAAAMDAGVSSQQYRSDLQMRSENAMLKAQVAHQQAMERENAQEMQRRQAYMSLLQEAQRLQEIYPQLNLDQMLQDPQTMRTIQALQIAGAKDPVRTVYEAGHRDQIMGGLAAKAVQTGAQKVAAAVAANQRRPDENGTQAQGGIKTTFDPRNMSRKQREDIKRRVALGEKIPL